MATNKNITMKNYNGTDYDTLYPKTQTSQVLGNWDLTKVSGLLSATEGGTGVSSLDELAINFGLNNKYTQIKTGTYVGTGTYGINNKNSLTFDFYPSFMVVVRYGASGSFTDEAAVVYAGQNSYSTSSTQGIYSEGKTLYWWYSSAAQQLNTSNIKYAYIALGTNSLTSFERLITTSGTITLPVTGTYYLEMHGGGGGSGITGNIAAGGSGQVYNSIQLSAGTYSVTIGKGGSSSYEEAATNGGDTSFGSYTVAGGLRNLSTTVGATVGQGNVGGDSVVVDTDNNVYNATNGGGLYPSYGGGGTRVLRYINNQLQTWETNGTQGCVYIKYLPSDLNIPTIRIGEYDTLPDKITIPTTGYYYLEMHGSGGSGYVRMLSSGSGWIYTGGYSGYVWPRVYLTAGEYDYTVGAKVKSEEENVGPNGNSTTFSTYTALGGNAASTTGDGAAVGNLTASEARMSSALYGFGAQSSNYSGPGCIYIDFLGTT